jgi:hypothetical protein
VPGTLDPVPAEPPSSAIATSSGVSAIQANAG